MNDDFADPKTDESIPEIARIFAAVILRLRGRAALLNEENGSVCATASLELSPPSPLSVIHGS